MEKIIRIGTRNSQLALWQATTVQKGLEDLGYKTQVVPIHSTGDQDLVTPLYEMGIVGVFTKTLDLALLRNEIDIAVHSMKDVPTLLPKGIVQAAVLERGLTQDILVTKDKTDFSGPCVIATGSLRRKAQWLHRFPHHQVVSLRGNVNTRLQKLADENWQGAIFAKAGLQRIGVLPDDYMELDWMLPAPAQGAVVVATQENNDFALAAAKKLNNTEAFCTTFAERAFLRELEGGCTAPIAALARVEEDTLFLKGSLFSLDGKTALEVEKSCPVHDFESLGQLAGQEILNNGGKTLMQEIKAVTGRKTED